MIELLHWFVFLLRFGLSVALIVVIQMNARRVGRSLWLLATLPLLRLLMQLLGKTLTWMTFEHPTNVYLAVAVIDTGMTALTAALVFVGLWLLRSG